MSCYDHKISSKNPIVILIAISFMMLANTCSKKTSSHISDKTVSQSKHEQKQDKKKGEECNDIATCTDSGLKYLKGDGVKKDGAKAFAYLIRVRKF